MRINHSVDSLVAQNALNTAQKSLSSSLTKLSTGLRINKASDDAAGLAVAEQLKTQVKGLSQAKRNAQDGIALLQIAEGAADEMSSILQRMRELAVQAANDTMTSTDRSYIDAEFSSLADEVQRIAMATQYNGMTLLDGTSSSFGGSGSTSSVLHIGANNNGGSASGTTDTLTISINGLTAGAIGLTLSGSDKTNVTNQTNASNAITAIDTAIQSVNTTRANLGAYVNRLDHAIANLENQRVNTQDAESKIRDVDFAEETTNYTRAQILSQSATSMLAQANSLPQSVLGLLG